MDYSFLTGRLLEKVDAFFQSHRDERLVYHNRSHTEGVVSAAMLMADHYKLSERDRFVVNTAAWFHDLGYYVEPSDHERRGAEMAADFLKENNAPEEDITAVQGCILATRMPQNPVNLLEQIVCDADLFHLGKEEFPEKSKLMRKECTFFFAKNCDKEAWRNKTIKLFQTHQYHTDYARTHLAEKKQANLKKLIAKAEAAKGEAIPTMEDIPVPLPPGMVLPKEGKGEGKKDKSDRPDRGIETMFRISSNNHQRLSDMADNKAHIMITTTSIIISVLLSVLLRKLEEYPHLTIPAILLLFVCVVTMVFSILATRPTIPPGTFTEEDIKERRVNLLFFGNFYQMSLQEYAQGMEAVMGDRAFLYGSLIRDIYSQGVVLGRKYKLLRVGYNVFMFGIVVSVLAFVVASVLVAR